MQAGGDEGAGSDTLIQKTFNDKYLGLPIHIGSSKSSSFEYLKEGCGNGSRDGKKDCSQVRAKRF